MVLNQTIKQAMSLIGVKLIDTDELWILQGGGLLFPFKLLLIFYYYCLFVIILWILKSISSVHFIKYELITLCWYFYCSLEWCLLLVLSTRKGFSGWHWLLNQHHISKNNKLHYYCFYMTSSGIPFGCPSYPMKVLAFTEQFTSLLVCVIIPDHLTSKIHQLLHLKWQQYLQTIIFISSATIAVTWPMMSSLNNAASTFQFSKYILHLQVSSLPSQQSTIYCSVPECWHTLAVFNQLKPWLILRSVPALGARLLQFLITRECTCTTLKYGNFWYHFLYKQKKLFQKRPYSLLAKMVKFNSYSFQWYSCSTKEMFRLAFKIIL